MQLPSGVRSQDVVTRRLRTHYLEHGPDDGVPVVLVHGNLSTARFFEPLMLAGPAGHRFVAPDMRGFGDSESLPLDATRGLGDWADDVRALVVELGIERPVHLLGWSTGGAAIAAYAMQHPVASLTFLDPVSPYGFGGVREDGTPCFPDWAGSGGGVASPDFVDRLRAQDRGSASPFSPRNVMNGSYWATTHRETPEREDVLVDEILKSVLGDDGYPGDSVPSEHWPSVAPGTRGILNALSGRYCDWSTIVDLDPKPPVLWAHGSADIVIADGSAWDLGTLGAAGLVPGWPGADVFPPQPMVTQIAAVLGRYAERGGAVRTERFEGSGHFPPADAPQAWTTVFHDFLAAAEA